MSGGHFNYEDMKIIEWIDIIKKDKYPTEKLQKLLHSVSNILHSYDWFMSGDTGESEFKHIYYAELQNIKELSK